MPAELRSPRKGETPNEKAMRLKAASAWRKVHCWHPNQIRHTTATEIRARYGLEAPQVVLGHAHAAITQIYAERDLSKAAAIMEAIG
jgi:site-specific recombinase XerC